MASDAMNTDQVLELMAKIYSENIISPEQADFSEEKLEATFKDLNLTFKQTVQLLCQDFIDIAAVTTITAEWKFICLNFYCLHLLNKEMKKDELLSVAQSKDLKKYIKTLVHVGILQNLNPRLPHFKPLRSYKVGIQTQYYMLKGTVCGLFKYAMLPTLRYHILYHILEGMLVALFQLAYCPIKKPLSYIEGGFLMTEEFYGELLGDQDRFQGFIEAIQNSVSPAIYLKEIMILFRADSPNWFKKAVSATLTSNIKQKDGLENIFRTMLAGVYDNNSTIWKVIEIITQIIVTCVNSTDFDTCMGPQVENLLKIAIECSSPDAIAFEKLFASVVRFIHPIKQDRAESLLNSIFRPLKELSNENDRIYSKDQVVSFAKDIQQSIRVIHYIFLDTKDTSLPIDNLKPFISILFKIYLIVNDSGLISMRTDIKEIIEQHMKALERPATFLLFDNFVFNLIIPEYLNFRNDIVISVKDNSLMIQFSKKHDQYDVVKSAHIVYSLCKSNTQLFLRYFGFLLNCLSHEDKYFQDSSLLESEDAANLSTFGKRIAVYEMLSILSAEGMTNKYFTDKIPEEMFEYFNQVFINATKKNSQKNSTELVFTIAMILEDIVRGKQYDLSQFEIFKSIQLVHDETDNNELKMLLNKVLGGVSDNKPEMMQNDEIEEIIQETYNESIPMKGHGLIALERLISSKHPKAVERKQYIFTVFKENLCNRDTYIYQAAIKGLAGMANLDKECTDLVLETLCDEYAEFPREEFLGVDANEMRLKIGEVLVQVSKKLGEMAPNYKALLINTFLNGTKDDDHLIRASALANLGEICNVLGFKLGPIVTEILGCVHSIINTDKHSEPRRAAVLVIRQLLAGLGLEMLTVLKDDILPIYRTLKFLYKNDHDDILILQSQLALEELNNNMKDLIFPEVEMDAEKKVVVLK